MYGIFLYANTQYASNVKTLNITLSETLTTSGALKNNDSVFLEDSLTFNVPNLTLTDSVRTNAWLETKKTGSNDWGN